MAKGPSLFIITVLLFLLLTAPGAGEELESRRILLCIFEESLEVEVFVQEGQILVPTRILADVLQADLDWIPSLSTLRIHYHDQEYLLRVQDHLVQVEGTVKELRVPVLLEEGRTYLSLLCMANLFGFRLLEEGGVYQLERPSHQLQEIRYEEGKISFQTKGDPDIHFQDDFIRERVMVEILDVEKGEDFQLTGFTGDIPVERVRIQQPEVDRMVVTFFLNRWQEYFTEKIPGEEEWVFQMTPGATITQLTYDGERNRFVVVARGEMKEYSRLFLEDPMRLVIDIPMTRLEIEEEYLPIAHPEVGKVRVSEHEENLTRLVFDMETRLDFDFSLSPDGRFLVLSGEQRDLLIHDIAFREVGGRPEVLITGTQSLYPDIFYLPDPDRLVLDFPYSALRLEEEILEVGKYPVSSVRASQFSSEKSRVVIDLLEHVDYLVKTDPLHPERTVIAFPPGNFHVFLQDTPAATRVVIDTPQVLDYEMERHSYPDRLVVDLKEVILDISPGDFPKGNGMVEQVHLTHFPDDPMMTRLTFELPYYSGHQIVSTPRRNRLEIDLFKSDLRNRVIFLDPGHGGEDPGAVGITGTFEKDVVLDISLRLQTLLRQAGARVIMSRERDVFVDLYQRVEEANQSPAEIFVSVHANSVAHDFPMGTETYVSNNPSSDSLRLAHLVQQELLQALGLYNRGVKRRDFYVIKATHMPSILVEVAFLSNEQEEALLKNPAFRQRSAEAIFSGIEKYFQSP